MIGSDTAAAQGFKGPFWNTLRGFHHFWERIDIICPFVSGDNNLKLFNNVYFHPLPNFKLSTFLVLEKGLKICKENQPDLIVIHAYGMQFMSWGGWLLARRTLLPFVVEVHHIEGMPISKNLRDDLRRISTLAFLQKVRNIARAFRVVNRAELPLVLEKIGIETSKIKVVYSIYLDRNVFRPIARVKKEFDLIFVGRLVHNKGLDILMEVYQKLKEKNPSVKFLIIGKGALEAKIKRYSNVFSGIRHLHSLSSPEDVAKAYNQAKLVVCASYAEGGPRYVLEAMACGLPAVSTPVGLMKEVVRNYETGFLLNDWSADRMTDRIEEILTNEYIYHKCSQRASEIAAKFDYDVNIEKYAMTYRSLI